MKKINKNGNNLLIYLFYILHLFNFGFSLHKDINNINNTKYFNVFYKNQFKIKIFNVINKILLECYISYK